MTTPHDPTPTPGREPLAAPTDLIISRIVDGAAEKADWAALDAYAAKDPGVWRELAMAQRFEQALRGATARAVDPALAVEVPQQLEGQAPLVHQFQTRQRMRLVGVWGGWAAAAAIALAFATQPRTPAPSTNTAGIVPMPALSSQEYFDRYVSEGQKSGTVVGVVPDKVVVETTASPDGKGYEVIYVRQVIERTRVEDLYKFSEDELGNLTAVPANIEVRRSGPPV